MASKKLSTIVSDLASGKTTSEALVSYYIQRIQTYDAHLNAVATLNQQALNEARVLDIERQEKGPRSLLHGVPILIKDNIDVKNMPNTANARVMKDFFPKNDAPLIKQLKRAGLIILGKANLSEWAYFMSENDMPSGYGSLHGQVVHPYDADIDPLGSSTGSAVAVAADLVPLSIGTETNGSLMAPAYQTQIVSLKPTFGQISNDGIIPISPVQDTAGPMGRTVKDVTLLYDVLTNQHISETLGNQEKSYKIGIIQSPTIPVSNSDKSIYDEMTRAFEDFNYEVTSISIDYKPVGNTETLLYEMKSSLNAYLKEAGHPKVKSLKDIINFNKNHKDICLPYGQTLLEKSEATSGNLNDPDYIEKRANLIKKSDIFNDILNTQKLDALVSIYWLPETPISGLPSVVVPARELKNKRPKSLVFIGRKNHEKDLLNIAHVYELRTQKRKDPSLN